MKSFPHGFGPILDPSDWALTPFWPDRRDACAEPVAILLFYANDPAAAFASLAKSQANEFRSTFLAMELRSR